MKLFKIFSLILCLLLLTSCNKPPATISFMAMDTYIHLKADTDNKTLNQVKSLTEDLTNKFNAHSDSELSNLNNKGSTKVSKELLELIILSKEYANLTNGNFNPALYNITSLWKISPELKTIPSKGAIATALKSCNFNNIIINNDKVALQNNTKLDLGGIAKGYISQKAAEMLKSKGVKNAVLSFGGNVALIGNNHNKNWKVAITNPVKPKGDYLGVLSLEDTFVVTSGDYQRYAVIDGIKYHHIFAKDGYPAKSGLISVTIVCKNGTLADALSTALFVMGLDKALEFYQKVDSFEAVFVTEQKKVYVTDGLKDKFKLINEDFTYED